MTRRFLAQANAASRRRMALAGLALTSLFWAGNALVARGAGDMIAPLALAFFRWFFCALLLLPFTITALRRHLGILRAHAWKILVLAALSVSSYNSLLYFSAHSTTALNITLVSSLLPVVTMALSVPLLGQVVTRRAITGIICAFFGAAYIILRGNWQTLLTLDVHVGDGLMLLATFLWSLYSVLLRRWSLPIGGFDLFALLVPTGVIMLAPFYLLERSIVGTFVFTPALLLILAYVVVFASLAAYLLWNFGISQTSPGTAALFAYLIPLFTALLSMPVLGEYPEFYHLVGGLAILAGLWWSQR